MVSVSTHLMSAAKSERIGKFRIFTERDNRDRIIKIVYIDYVPVVRFHVDSMNERKLAVVELVERCQCSNKMAGKLCGFHQNSVFKYVRIKKLLGVEALFQDDRGPKSPYKYVGEVRSHIKKLIRKYPEWTDQEVAEQAAADLETTISRSAVARIRTENEEKKSKLPVRSELIEMAREIEAMEREQIETQQLLLSFTWDKELEEKAKEFSKESAPKAKRESEREFISRLQQGERSAFAGNLMHHVFLDEFGFTDFLNPFELNAGCTYQASDIFLTLFHSAQLGIGSIEALKLLNANDLGVLTGQSRSPDKTVIREHLSQMASRYLSEQLIEEFADRALVQGRIDREVFFIDGHFLPYYGLNVIAKGYYTVRRLAMRGNEIYAVTDLQGRPVFFITETNEIDFRPIISRCADKLKGLGITRPIVVFDRGGYGIDFFATLGKEADFITWAKYVSDKALQEIGEENFVAGIQLGDGKYVVAETRRTFSESSQTAKKEGRSQPTTIDIRMVVLKDIESGKRMGILTNNTGKPCWDIAWYMLHRWGDSENFFKEMMARFNLNYHPGYDISELENQPLVDNPDIPLARKAIQILKQEIKGIETSIHETQAVLDTRLDHRLAKKLTKLERELNEKKEDLSGFENKRLSLPEKVSIIDLLKGKRMSRCDLEKKKLYDLIQFMAFHSRERLVELFRDCYCDNRDIKQVLDMITSRGGYVKLIGQTLIVLLDWIQSKKHREAAERLCRLLNCKKIRMAGRLKANLFFCISKIPHRASALDDDMLHKFI